MGLKKSYKSKYGVTAPNAYHRIRDMRGDNFGNVRYNIEIYYDQNARKTGMQPLSEVRKTIDGELASKLSVIHEIYETLKGEPDYSGATDIFEVGTFPVMSEQYVENFYILKTTLDDGYSIDSGNLTNASMEGKCLLDGQVISGTFYNVNASNVTDDGYGYVNKGFINNAYVDGYVVQVLIGV